MKIQPYNITFHPTADYSEVLRGNLQIFHLWQCQTYTTIGVKVTDTYSKSYISRSLYNVLETQENDNNN